MNFTHRFIKRFNESRTFEEFMHYLTRFSYKLIKENNLQHWTRADFKTLWDGYKGV